MVAPREPNKKQPFSLRDALRAFALPDMARDAVSALSIVVLFWFCLVFALPTARIFLFVLAILISLPSFFSFSAGLARLLRSEQQRLMGASQATSENFRQVMMRLPDMLLLVWGVTHLTGLSYVPFNLFAITLWLIYFFTGAFFSLVRGFNYLGRTGQTTAAREETNETP